MKWTVTDTSGAPLACDKINGVGVTATLRDKQTVGGFTEVFTCDTGMGTSQTFEPGTYDIAWELDAANGTVLTTAPTQTGVVTPADTTTSLPDLTFAVNATGNVALTLDTHQAGGNCGTGADGAKIDAMTISLVHGMVGACEPVTFAISAGATRPAGTYTVDCTTPVTTGCIENDQTLTAMNVPTDKYTFAVHGTVAGAACWNNSDSARVPANAGTLTTTLNLAHAIGVPGC